MRFAERIELDLATLDSPVTLTVRGINYSQEPYEVQILGLHGYLWRKHLTTSIHSKRKAMHAHRIRTKA